MSLDSDLRMMIYGMGSKPAEFKGVPIRVQFNNEGDVYAMGGVGIVTEETSCECYPADVAGVKKGDSIIVDGMTYYVLKLAQPVDDATVLVLSEVAVNG